jgi:hypothetical protein
LGEGGTVATKSPQAPFSSVVVASLGHLPDGEEILLVGRREEGVKGDGIENKARVGPLLAPIEAAGSEEVPGPVRSERKPGDSSYSRAACEQRDETGHSSSAASDDWLARGAEQDRRWSLFASHVLLAPDWVAVITQGRLGPGEDRHASFRESTGRSVVTQEALQATVA